jgi:hypothetical protein
MLVVESICPSTAAAPHRILHLVPRGGNGLPRARCISRILLTRSRCASFELHLVRLPRVATGPGPGADSLREAELLEAIPRRPGLLLQVSVVRVGTTPGAVHDAETLAGSVASSRIATIPRTIAMYDVDWPCDFGIVGLHRKLSAKYDGPNEPPPPKPQWMRRKTYSRIAQQIEAGQERLNVVFVEGAQRILARIDRSKHRGARRR